MLRRTSPVNIWDLEIHGNKHSDSFTPTHTWAQTSKHPICSPPPPPPTSYIFIPSVPDKGTPAFTSVLSDKETYILSHTYFLLRKSYCATQTLYLSQTNTHFTNTERTAVTVSPVLSRIVTCPFYSWSPTHSGRSSSFSTENSHPSSHTLPMGLHHCPLPLHHCPLALKFHFCAAAFPGHPTTLPTRASQIL